MFIEPLGDGGIAHYTYNLIKALSKSKHKIFLFTNTRYEFENTNIGCTFFNRMFRLSNFLCRLFPWISQELTFPNYIRRTIKVIEYPFNAFESLYLIFRKRVSIVHFQTVNQIELFLILLYKIFGMKVVYTIHNVRPRHQEFKFYHAFIYKFLYRLCDKLIIHSEEGKIEVQNKFLIDPHKISVIPHGDYKFFIPTKNDGKEKTKFNLGISKDENTILFFGAIRSNKGLDNMILALPEIINQIEKVKLLIIGEPCEDYSKYSNLISKYNLGNYVYEDLKYISNYEVGKYFIASDIVVFPYKEITQSGVLQIAYAFGKPVVATATGGFFESVIDGKNGYLFPKDDINCLSEKIVKILSDPAKMEEMGMYSRYLSDRKYSWDQISKDTSKIYSELI